MRRTWGTPWWHPSSSSQQITVFTSWSAMAQHSGHIVKINSRQQPICISFHDQELERVHKCPLLKYPTNRYIVANKTVVATWMLFSIPPSVHLIGNCENWIVLPLYVQLVVWFAAWGIIIFGISLCIYVPLSTVNQSHWLRRHRNWGSSDLHSGFGFLVFAYFQLMSCLMVGTCMPL